jgi:hypothetical protein
LKATILVLEATDGGEQFAGLGPPRFFDGFEFLGVFFGRLVCEVLFVEIKVNFWLVQGFFGMVWCGS